MPAPIDSITDWHSIQPDMIIDVRSPAEFAEDHIPGAVNMPVFSNDQRAEIGTLYKQASAFVARRKGAGMVARNIAGHLDTLLQDKGPDFRPLIYCWRGGQRSAALARICSEIGWRSWLLEGGYKTYRRQVLADLDRLPAELRLTLIAGPTGTGKTRLLAALADSGAQILDLEALARHRGSLLGGLPDQPQPSQKGFESRLAYALYQLDPARPVFVEAESSRIGAVQIAPRLWSEMQRAGAVELRASLAARVAFLLADYDFLLQDPARFQPLVSGMRHRHGAEQTGHWQDFLDKGDFPALAEALITVHYDPAYKTAAKRHQRKIVLSLHLEALDSTALKQAARQITGKIC